MKSISGTKNARSIYLGGVLALFGSAIASRGEEPRLPGSSQPPDTTQYQRPALPMDMAVARTKATFVVPFIAVAALGGTLNWAKAQQLPVPEVKPCHEQSVDGKMKGSMLSRKDANHTGDFEITVDARCQQGKPSVSNLEINAVNLTDTAVKGKIFAQELSQLTSLGKAVTPTVFLSGPCKSTIPGDALGCRLWIMFVDSGPFNGSNNPNPDLVSFIVVDESGHRLAYGTGTVTLGDVYIRDNE